MITEEEETEEENLEVREQMEKDDDEIGNMIDLYYKLQKNFLGQRNLRGEQYHDLAKWLSYYLLFIIYFILFYFSFILNLLYRREYSERVYKGIAYWDK